MPVTVLLTECACSYPAGHLYVHQLLYNLTNSGKDVWQAQHLYSAVYVATQAIAGSIYQNAGNVPNWILLLLPLSKRLHSIYVLRLFNDCWAVLGAQSAVLAFATEWDTLGILLYRCAASLRSTPRLLTCLVLHCPSRCPSFYISPGYLSCSSNGTVSSPHSGICSSCCPPKLSLVFPS